MDQFGETIKDIISKHLDMTDYHVFLFGSRAEGTGRKFSDVDIGIEGKKPVPSSKMVQIKDEFEESDLPFTVDVVDFSTVSPRFKKTAKKNIISISKTNE